MQKPNIPSRRSIYYEKYCKTCILTKQLSICSTDLKLKACKAALKCGAIICLKQLSLIHLRNRATASKYFRKDNKLRPAALVANNELMLPTIRSGQSPDYVQALLY